MDQDIVGQISEIKSTILSKIGEGDTRLSQLQKQVDALDRSLADRQVSGPGHDNTLRKALQDSPELTRLRELGRGSAVISLKDLPVPLLEMKTAITSSTLGAGTSGVLMPDRIGGIIPLASRRLFVRDLLPKSRTTQGSVYYIRENSFTNAASPAAEASDKGESALGFTTVQRPIITLAHWIPISRQALDDFDMLLGYLQTKLLYGLRYIEEQQILAGAGTGLNYSGLIHEGTAFNTALLSAPAGWTKADILRRAAEQVDAADEAALGFFVLHPNDWADIELSKDGFGRYVTGNPRESLAPSLWGKPVVVSTGISAGTFLAGSSTSCELVDRMDATFELSFEHDKFFTQNMVAARLESRGALLIYRPNAFVRGSFTTSPAS